MDLSNEIDDIFDESIENMIDAEVANRNKKISLEDAEIKVKKIREIDKATADQIGPKPIKRRIIPYSVSMDKLLKIYDNFETNVVNNKTIKYLWAADYLFGGRITETLNIKRGDLEVVTKKGKDGVKRAFLNCNLLTLKRSKVKGNTTSVRQVITPIFGKEARMANDILEYSKNFDNKERIFRLIFNSKRDDLESERTKAWRFFHKVDYGPIRVIESNGKPGYRENYLGATHYLRKCRLTHLHNYYNFNEQMIKVFAGWSSTRMVGVYVNVSLDDMIDRFSSVGD